MDNETLKPIITIDGPAGTGKSTLASALASALGFTYLSSGLMYRDIAFHIKHDASGDGRNYTPNTNELTELSQLMTDEISQLASTISQLPWVREKVDVSIKKFIESRDYKGLILEGRDMGTTVCPQADLKIYLEADTLTRTQRCVDRQINTQGYCGRTRDVLCEEMGASLKERDERDRNRELSPLRKADDAILMNNSNMSVDDEVAIISHLLRSRCHYDPMADPVAEAIRKDMRRRRFDKAYMSMAVQFATLSRACRLKVGCIIVSDTDQIISQGFNGTPSGMDNCCEYLDGEGNMRTHPYVLHAETNAMAKCMRNNISTVNATIYITASPCIDCAKMIIQSGIRRVVFLSPYRCMDGVNLLTGAGVQVDWIRNMESDIPSLTSLNNADGMLEVHSYMNHGVSPDGVC